MILGKQFEAIKNLSSGMPVEALTRNPLIEVYGRNRVLIENHRGIIGYEDENIMVKTSDGYISVFGSDLKLAYMSKEKLVITGCIFTVALHGAGE